MILTDRRLYILMMLAAVLAAITIVLYARKPGADRDIAAGTPLVQGLDVEKVGRISIVKGNQKITLARQGKQFVLVEHSNYPASTEKVNRLLISLLDIRAADRVTANASNHAELGVTADSPDATVVRIYGTATEPAATETGAAPASAPAAAGGKPMVAVIVGKDAPLGGAQYVRLDGQDAVYTTQERPSISTEFNQYVSASLANVPPLDVDKVTVQTKDGSYTLTRLEGSAGIAMDPLPAGKRTKANVAQNVLEALSSLPFDDVMTADSLDSTGIAFDASYTCQTKKNLTYIVRLGAKGDDQYIRVTCTGPSAAVVEKSRQIGENEAKAELEKKSAILAAADTAVAFNEQHGKWIYKVSKWTAEKLRHPAADLLEDIPASQPATAATQPAALHLPGAVEE